MDSLGDPPGQGKVEPFTVVVLVHQFPLNVLSDLWSAPGTGCDDGWAISHLE